ncbi:hypothetical protein [Streptomyces sp. B22F1]|uniref:hypothetical protein n=1 Tax=Streptomyces sp. B22F1 TaxID=3153566 RepID=UPI00325C75EF
MEVGQQLLTISAVLVGAAMTYMTNTLAERRRLRHELHTRWDDKKLDAYGDYIDQVRACVFLAVSLYEHREGILEAERSEQDLSAELAEAIRLRGRAFERIMLLGGDRVVEAGHEVNAIAQEIDWQATGRTTGTLAEWRQRHRTVFQRINAFHDSAREDLGVFGRVTGQQHPPRDLLLPPARREQDNNDMS